MNLDSFKVLTTFTRNLKNSNEIVIGHFAARGNDFQNQSAVFIDNKSSNIKGGGLHTFISKSNLIQVSISFTIRHCIEANWLNDRDQFLFPIDGWQSDLEFQNDCLVFTLFHSQNKVSVKNGINHWIPFEEYLVGSRENYDSDFMYSYIKGTQNHSIVSEEMFDENQAKRRDIPLEFSPEAKAVFDSGRKLWQYYHSKPKVNVNASLYDIREYFQGRNEKGKMNNKSTDEQYNLLIGDLRNNLKLLAKKIEPKVYEYGFLKA